MAEGDARQRLVDEHLGLARAAAAAAFKNVGQPHELDELVGLATLGLLEAADRFDPAAGFAFSTFAHYRIHGAIYDGLRRMGRLPRREYAKLRAQQRADDYLEARAVAGVAADRAGGRPARTDEDELRAMFETLRGAATVLVTSLDAGDQIDGAASPEAQVGGRQLRARLREAIAALPDRERQLIELHYYADKTLLEAGRELGVSKSWASRLHARAIELLQRLLGE